MVLIEAASDEALALIGEEHFGYHTDIRSFFRSLNVPFYPDNQQFYAGVGSRETPLYALAVMQYVSHYLSGKYTVRSGSAEGADMAFELGSRNQCEIFLPWKGFMGSAREFTQVAPDIERVAELLIDGKLIKNMPRVHDTEILRKSKNCSFLKLHRRNCYQVLGRNLNNPVSFVLCWTDDKAITSKMTSRNTGGTGTAIKIASNLGIDVFNLSRKEHLLRIVNMMKKHDKNIEERIIERVRFFKNNPAPWFEKSLKRELSGFDSEREFIKNITRETPSLDLGI